MVSILAYFTDPMGDEFRKAIEEAMKEIEDEETHPSKKREENSGSSRSAKNQRRKSRSTKLSKSEKQSLK